jgi:hypothetical protein
LITFVHVIDHLIDPSKVLDRAWRHVRPGGCVMAIVHNSESLLARVLGERFPPYNLYHHYFFSKRTLAELFRARGFEVMTVASTRNRYSIGFFTRRAPGIPDGVRRAAATALDGIGMGRIPVTLPVGNIGIVARRPSEH